MAFSPPLMFWEKLTIKKEMRETYTGKHILSLASGSGMVSPAVTRSAGGLGSPEVSGDHADAPLSSPHSRAQVSGSLAPPQPLLSPACLESAGRGGEGPGAHCVPEPQPPVSVPLVR